MAASRANPYRVACLGRAFGPEAQAIIADCAPPEFEVVFDVEASNRPSPLMAESDFVLVTAPVTRDMLAAAPRLRFVHKWGIGVDKIDLEAARDLGVPVAITAGSNAGAVAEHTVMLILAALRWLSYADRTMREGKWLYTEMRPRCRMLAGRRVGIFGFGNIGRAVAQRLAGFEVDIVYHDVRRAPEDVERRLNARYLPFDELVATSDIVTLHAPGGGANANLFDRTVIGAMKPGSVLANAARGDLVDEEALVDALLSGHLLAAGLDAFEPEPLPPTSRLTTLDNVVLTPHTAGSVLDNVAPVARHAFRNMQRHLAGQAIPPSDLVVDPPQPRRFD